MRHNLKSNEFYFDTITNRIQGATVREGDYIKTVRFTLGYNPPVFSDGWRVERIGGELGIYWGFKNEFTPFRTFAPQCIFEKGEPQK